MDNARTMAVSDPLYLPFWDDFSFAGSDTLWISNRGVSINTSWAISAPTINVATFDGSDDLGQSYSVSGQNQINDRLTSRTLLLDGLVESDDVVLSFYYQKQGNGYGSISDESFSLYFYDAGNAAWELMWQVQANDISETDEFLHKRVRLEQRHLTNEFQFRFENFGNPGGIFDAWHLDYVYLNKGRPTGTAEESLGDQAIASSPRPLFGDFTAVPKQYLSDWLASDSIRQTMEVTNFDNSSNPVPIELDYGYNLYLLTSKDTTVIHQYIEDETLTLPSTIRSRINIPLDSISAKDLTEIESLDTVKLMSEVYLTSIPNLFFPDGESGELVNDRYNFRLNDTVRHQFVINNQLAYDDGSAELAAGVNNPNGKIAVSYDFGRSGHVIGVAIHFPQMTLGQTQINREFDLYITDRLDNDLLIREYALYDSTGLSAPSSSSAPNQFTNYMFDRTVSVNNEFFVVIQQKASDYLPIGLDMNTNQSQRIRYNIANEWIEITDELPGGSLMIRPIFSKTEITPPSVTKNIVTVFPNPADQEINIQGHFENYQLISPTGDKILEGSDSSINARILKDGIYFMQVETSEGIHSQKVIIHHP